MSGLPAVELQEGGSELGAPVKGSAARDNVIDLFAKGKARKQPALSDDQRQELVIEFRLKARKLGRSILRKWHARMDLEEVDSIVDLSLCEAVRRFDPTKGASFMTFLYYHLKGNLIRAVSAAATANVIPQEGDAGKSDDAPAGNVNAIDVAEALCGSDNLLPDEALFKKQLVKLSRQACSRLDPLEREVIERIYLGGQQLMDIANNLGYSRCHISRVKKKALETLNQDLALSLQLENAESQQGPQADAVKRQLDRKVIHRRRPRSRKAHQSGLSRSSKRAANE